MFCFDWVNGRKDVPVNVGGAWWSGDGSLVNPSVFEINHVHEGTIEIQVSNIGCTSEIIPFH
tara:strand:- start:34 stop:219 length:186 start_codon:yes stop_codon:yes gene_type:complete